MLNKRKIPSILLASGIFHPDVGGPAIHVRHIAEHFSSLGWKVTVIAFGNSKSSNESYSVIRISRQMPKIFSWLLYALRVGIEAFRSDAIYGFDLTTSGLPSAFFSRLFGKPFILRIGGDPIWERIIEKEKRFIPMRAYYEQKLFIFDKPILYRLIRYVVQSAVRVITYCDFLVYIYENFYDVNPSRVALIRNPFTSRKSSGQEENAFTFIFAGRFVSYKNIPRVIRVFSRIVDTHPEARLLLIGDGPEESEIRTIAEPLGDRVSILPKMSQSELFKRIENASVALAPAITEFNPNFILESLALGKPAIISHDNGLSVSLPDKWQFDPLDDESLFQAMRNMLNQDVYASSCETIAQMKMESTWNSVVSEHEKLIRAILKLPQANI